MEDKLLSENDIDSDNMCDNMTLHPNVLNALKLLCTEANELYLPKEVERVHNIPKPLDFYREWVAPNVPVVFEGAAKGWPAMTKWTPSYITRIINNKEITVAVTPTGYADAMASTIVDGKNIDCFVLPEEEVMTVGKFFEKLKVKDKTKGILYIQRQNSNLTQDFPQLLPDIDQQLDWASETFGSPPVAINLWIGDERAVTSLHKDPFENIYTVISGWKEFTIFAPTDRPWLPHRTVPVAKYQSVGDDDFEVVFTGDTVPWIDLDPLCPDYVTYPQAKNAKGLRVFLKEGDTLYLPALWFHHVTQSHGCIAVNHWFDMKYDIKYAYYQLLDDLSKACIEDRPN